MREIHTRRWTVLAGALAGLMLGLALPSQAAAPAKVDSLYRRYWCGATSASRWRSYPGRRLSTRGRGFFCANP